MGTKQDSRDQKQADGFKDRMGFNQYLLWDNPETREGLANWLERVFGFYGEDRPCVDIQVIKDQIPLHAKTADYVYSEFTPLDLHYRKGGRPFLEKVLAEIIQTDMSDLDKFLNIMRWCRDNRAESDPRVQFSGGTEEDLIKRGGAICNEISRVFAVLCQIAGLPARLVCVHIAGHMMAEAYVDGSWSWCDPMKGNYAFLDNGSLASWWDMIQDPLLIDRQEPAVWDDCRPPVRGLSIGDRSVKPGIDPEIERMRKAGVQARIRDCYLHPEEAAAVGNYFVWDHAKYDYPWILEPADPARVEAAVITENRIRVKRGFPNHYFNPVPQNLPLRVKGGEGNKNGVME